MLFAQLVFIQMKSSPQSSHSILARLVGSSYIRRFLNNIYFCGWDPVMFLRSTSAQRSTTTWEDKDHRNDYDPQVQNLQHLILPRFA